MTLFNQECRKKVSTEKTNQNGKIPATLVIISQKPGTEEAINHCENLALSVEDINRTSRFFII